MKAQLPAVAALKDSGVHIAGRLHWCDDLEAALHGGTSVLDGRQESRAAPGFVELWAIPRETMGGT